MDGIAMPAFLFGPPTKPNPDTRRRAWQAAPRLGKRRVSHAGRRVLIVEDEAMIAGLIEVILREAEWSVVGPFATLERALATIERERLDAALLDVRVNGHDAFAVADVLVRRRIPLFSSRALPENRCRPAIAIARISPSRSRQMRFWRCWTRSWGARASSRTGPRRAPARKLL